MITTIHPGLFTTVQDEGRWGYQAFGMPVAGAMDCYAYYAANILAGNKPAAAVLEMTLRGGHFRFEADYYVSICGADMQARLNGTPVKNWSGFLVAAGSELVFDYAISGCRSYVAVNGGINTPVVLGSRSTYTRAAVGGLDGRALQAGDVIPIGKDADAAPRTSRLLPVEFIPAYRDQVELRVLLGPQDDYFSEAGITTFFTSTYCISTEADRMGYRLEGSVIEHKEKADIISDALCQGAIQVPGHGMPIIMMADRQTTGGYTKIGTVIGPDLSLLAQAKPGDSIVFKKCSEDEAEAVFALGREAYGRLQQVVACCDQQPSGPARHFKITVNKQLYHVEIREVK
ncbi:biotin-dependent carboxyltransferase family protein [Sporomusa sp. GT1]|uniref:5-oxoprolinase subunit C family protein n=1 Tax=Sporomusa sp. GT1 TaxID=1534747 RepID=UPI001666D706|nr:biotin-dependent carboxyltransferase family protein [Sporomusa sp. GT1]